MIFDHELYQEDLKNIIHENINWEILKGKNVLITGASGMIGTFLVDTLMKRNEIYHDEIKIYALSRNKNKLENKFVHYGDRKYLKLMVQDVGRVPLLDEEKYDFVIHAASNTHPKEYSDDPVGTITTNVFGTYYLLEYARKHRNCRVVLLSSVEIYGENRGDVEYFDEKYCGYLDCNIMRAGYPESKRLSEAMLQSYIVQYKVNGVIVRLGRIYGPTVEVDDTKAISQFIHKAVCEENIILKSEGNQLYSYSYVADAGQAILRCMIDGECGEAYNVADSASDMSLKEIAQYLARAVGKKVIFELPDEGEKSGYSIATKALLNPEKIKQIGWRAKYSMQDGLRQTILILRDERCRNIGMVGYD